MTARGAIVGATLRDCGNWRQSVHRQPPGSADI